MGTTCLVQLGNIVSKYSKRFSLKIKNSLKKKGNAKIPYASTKESLIYVHFCMPSYIMYVTKVLGRYF